MGNKAEIEQKNNEEEEAKMNDDMLNAAFGGAEETRIADCRNVQERKTRWS